MIAYLALWSAAATMLVRTARFSTDRLLRILAVGLAAAFLAQFIFQMTDAIPLGSKVGLLFWFALPLSCGIFQLFVSEIGHRQFRVRWKTSRLDLLGIWALFSLLSIAFIGEHPYVGLTIAVFGGGILGYRAVQNYLVEQFAR
jgi:hypothetical protein